MNVRKKSMNVLRYYRAYVRDFPELILASILNGWKITKMICQGCRRCLSYFPYSQREEKPLQAVSGTVMVQIRKKLVSRGHQLPLAGAIRNH